MHSSALATAASPLRCSQCPRAAASVPLAAPAQHPILIPIPIRTRTQAHLRRIANTDEGVLSLSLVPLEEEEAAVEAVVVEVEAVLEARNRIHSHIDAMSAAPFVYPGSEEAEPKAFNCVPHILIVRLSFTAFDPHSFVCL